MMVFLEDKMTSKTDVSSSIVEVKFQTDVDCFVVHTDESHILVLQDQKIIGGGIGQFFIKVEKPQALFKIITLG